MDKEMLAALKELLNPIQIDIADMKGDINGMKSDIGNMKVGIDGMKSDIGNMKVDIDGMKSDIVELRQGQDELRQGQDELRLGQDELRQGQTGLAEFERGTRVLLESTNKNVKLIAEAQSTSVAKLQQLDRIEATLNDVKSDTEVIKDVVSWHSNDLKKLKQA